MPRLRNNIHPLTKLLRGYDLNGENLSAVLGCSPPTARFKIEHPGRLTIRELITIHNKVGIPISDLRDCIC